MWFVDNYGWINTGYSSVMKIPPTWVCPERKKFYQAGSDQVSRCNVTVPRPTAVTPRTCGGSCCKPIIYIDKKWWRNAVLCDLLTTECDQGLSLRTLLTCWTMPQTLMFTFKEHWCGAEQYGKSISFSFSFFLWFIYRNNTRCYKDNSIISP